MVKLYILIQYLVMGIYYVMGYKPDQIGDDYYA